MRLAAARDWTRLGQWLRGEWPQPIPERVVVERAADWWGVKLIGGGAQIAIDTEYTVPDRKLLILGIGWRTVDGTTGIQFVEWQRLAKVAQAGVTMWLRGVLESTPALYQNAVADLPVLEQNLGITLADHRCGFNDTLLAHAVLWSELPHDLEFLASLYSRHNKLKHLARTDPGMYNWGDVLATLDTWDALQAELAADPATEQVYRTQSLPLVPIILESMAAGVAVDAERVRGAAQLYLGKMAEAGELAEAYAGWPINVGSNDHLKLWLYDVEGLPVQKHKDTKKPTVNEDAVAVLLTKAPEHPLLEARVAYAEAMQAQSHYIQPAMEALDGGDGRLYPRFLIHAQASGRWSTNDPPLAQLPSDLRDILTPDRGAVWLGWDWDQIELRLLAALAGDQPLLDAFTNAWDIHTINACDIFGWAYPPDLKDPHKAPTCQAWREGLKWEGKDDVRRRFAKAFVYRLHYGGDPRRAGDLPGSKTLGLDGPRLVQASQRYLLRHPAISAYWGRCDVDVRDRREVRTFAGRRRRLLGQGNGVNREASNHGMQGGVSDVLNLSTVAIKAALPYARLVYTMHDSAIWSVPSARELEAQPVMDAIVTQPYMINGREIRFPCTWKEPRRG